MKGCNQLCPSLLRTLGRFCLNGSTPQEALSAVSIRVEDSIRREVHTSSGVQSATEQRSESASEAKIETVFSRHLVNPASSQGFIRGMSTLTEASPTSPPDVQGISIDHIVNNQ